MSFCFSNLPEGSAGINLTVQVGKMEQHYVRIRLPKWLVSYKQLHMRQQKCIEGIRELSASLRRAQRQAGVRQSAVRAILDYRKALDFRQSLSDTHYRNRIRFQDELSYFSRDMSHKQPHERNFLSYYKSRFPQTNDQRFKRMMQSGEYLKSISGRRHVPVRFPKRGIP